MKNLLKCVLYIFLFGLFYLNCSLFYQPDFIKIDGQVINKGVYHQLQFLKAALNAGAGKEM